MINFNFRINLNTDKQKNNTKKIQTNKQKISSLKAVNQKCHDGRFPEEVAVNRVAPVWKKDETMLAMIAFSKFGQNFKVILSSSFVVDLFLIQSKIRRQLLNFSAQKLNLMFESSI